MPAGRELNSYKLADRPPPGLIIMLPPLEIFLKIMGYMENPTMSQYVRISQVNRHFRSIFLSDEAWAKFDVYGVRGKDPVYQYRSYELTGVAAHFFEHLNNSPIPLQEWFLAKNVMFDGRCVTSEDKYSQMHLMGQCFYLKVHDKPDPNHLFDQYEDGEVHFRILEYQLGLVKPDVYELWAIQPPQRLQDPRANSILKRLSILLVAVPGGLQRALHMPEIIEVRQTLQNDRDLALSIVSVCGEVLQIVGEQFQDDREIVLASVRQSGQAFLSASERLRGDPEIVSQALKKGGKFLRLASTELRSNREIVLTAVRQDGLALIAASEALRGDRSVVLEAVKHSCGGLQSAPVEVTRETLRNNPDLFLYASVRRGGPLKFASEALCGDRGVVLEAVRRDGEALQHASETLRGDPEIVLQAVKNCGGALEWSSEALRENRDFVLDVLTQLEFSPSHCLGVLKFVADAVRQDRDFVCMLIGNGVPVLHFATQGDIRDNRELVLQAVQNGEDELGYASPRLCNDREIVLRAVSNNGSALRYASEGLRLDPEVVLLAVENCVSALDHASGRLRSDREFVLRAMRIDNDAVKYASGVLLNDPDFVLKALRRGYRLRFKSSRLARDKSFMLRAVAIAGKALQDAKLSLQADKEVVLAAVRQSSRSLRFAISELWSDPDIHAAAWGKRKREHL